jgi:hypothetical protein
MSVFVNKCVRSVEGIKEDRWVVCICVYVCVNERVRSVEMGGYVFMRLTSHFRPKLMLIRN